MIPNEPVSATTGWTVRNLPKVTPLASVDETRTMTMGVEQESSIAPIEGATKLSKQTVKPASTVGKSFTETPIVCTSSTNSLTKGEIHGDKDYLTEETIECTSNVTPLVPIESVSLKTEIIDGREVLTTEAVVECTSNLSPLDPIKSVSLETEVNEMGVTSSGETVECSSTEMTTQLEGVNAIVNNTNKSKEPQELPEPSSSETIEMEAVDTEIPSLTSSEEALMKPQGAVKRSLNNVTAGNGTRTLKLLQPVDGAPIIASPKIISDPSLNTTRNGSNIVTLPFQTYLTHIR
ncbi:unnamed protein product [Allacma fusca]|uniref:Uncharacterized protein n=1 Tax=Allacma fusca TaxID=39272 RepID=A0A8J2JYD0_9HEXA|nr:unnamed protein product [Allacma fusca]